MTRAALNDERPPHFPRQQNRPYENWTRQDLLQRAHQLDVHDRSSMTKSQLIDAVRNRWPGGPQNGRSRSAEVSAPCRGY